MKKYDLYGGIFWLCVAIFMSGMGIKLGLGTPSYPGPGFFPFLVGLLLLGLSIGILILALRAKYEEPSFLEWPFFGK